LNPDELIRRLTATFLEEVRDHVRVFNEELMLLEKDPEPARRAEAIHALFRAAHSLKGASRAVSATAIEGIAHKLEDLLQRVRDGRRELTPEVFEVLFAAADGFDLAGKKFAEGINIDPALTALARRLELSLQSPDSSPPSARVFAPRVPPVVRLTRANVDPSWFGEEGDRIASDFSPVAADPIESTSKPAFVAAEPVRAIPQPPASVVEPAAPAAAVSHGNFVRIGRARLDALLRQGSELAVTRRRFAARREDLVAVQEHVLRVRAEWQAGARALRRFKREGPLPRDAAHSELPKRFERMLTSTDEELGRLAREVDRISGALREDSKALDRAAMPLEAQIHQLRLMPFARACEGLSRVVRDLSLAQQKQVDLQVLGGEIEVDRAIVEGLREPLLHLVRNAIDHGIEAPEARVAAGKPARATLRIAAVPAGDSVDISVTDDGRGLDLPAIRRGASERGLPGGALPERAIFMPGFSTARTISDVSGRGVGLDIVKTAAERMNGSVTASSDAGGARFVLNLPLTLSTVRVLLVRVGSEVLAVPSAAVELLLRVDPADLEQVAEKSLIPYRGAPIPSAALALILNFQEDERLSSAPLSAVVLRAEGRRAALIVDELLSEQDVVLKALGPRVQNLQYISSGTLLPTGEVALVLKPQAVVGAALDFPAFNPVRIAIAQQGARRRLLLADDSLTTRALERSILEAAGYDVTVAVDGLSAWQILQDRGADLLLSDVEMPQMDGLSLTRTVRTSSRFRDLPVILLTSRDSPDDRARGLEAGANAYLVKSAFDQTKLLQTIEQLL
jgi:two-component system chemotaxis sensor kinase CheA